jgi:hypothetical protein
VLLAPPVEVHPELEALEGAGPQAPDVRQWVPAELAVHSPSPEQARQVSFVVPPLAQTGVVPVHSVPLVHCTHCPKEVLVFSVSHAAVQPASWPTSVPLHWRQ